LTMVNYDQKIRSSAWQQFRCPIARYAAVDGLF
jgi:hypothetical protein